MRTNLLMKLFVGFLFQEVSSDDSLFSKFHQNRYKLKDVRAQLISYDKDFFNIFELKAFKFNRTTTAHNCSMNLKVDAKDNVEVLTQMYKFLSNEYRPIAIRYQLNLKKMVDANLVGLGDIKKCGNLTTFYFHKDVTYNFCNFVIDENQFPPLVPDGKYKDEVTYKYFQKSIAVIYLYGEIYTPMPYPKKK